MLVAVYMSCVLRNAARNTKTNPSLIENMHPMTSLQKLDFDLLRYIRKRTTCGVRIQHLAIAFGYTLSHLHIFTTKSLSICASY